MTVQIVEIAGQKMAMLPVADYERLVEMAEDRVDANAAVEAEGRRSAGEEYVPACVVDRIIAGESALRVWRQFRGLTQTALGSAVGVHKTVVSQMELGRTQGRPMVWRAMADVLRLTVEDILPVPEYPA